MDEYWEMQVGDYGTIKVHAGRRTPSSTVQDSSGYQDLDGRVQRAINKASGVVIAQAENTFEELNDIVEVVAYGFKDRLDRMEVGKKPQSAQLQFGISARVGVGMAIEAEAQADFVVTLKWELS